MSTGIKLSGRLGNDESSVQLPAIGGPACGVALTTESEKRPRAGCHLYLLAHRTEEEFKIGVAVDVHMRIAAIPHPIDISASFVARGTGEACYIAEKVMHRLLRRHRLPQRSGDGGTEWFASSCKPHALQLLRALASDLELTTPEPCPPPPPKRSPFHGPPTRAIAEERVAAEHKKQRREEERKAAFHCMALEGNTAFIMALRQWIPAEKILAAGLHNEGGRSHLYVLLDSKACPPDLFDANPLLTYFQGHSVAGRLSLISQMVRQDDYSLVQLCDPDRVTANADPTYYTEAMRAEVIAWLTSIQEMAGETYGAVCASYMEVVFRDWMTENSEGTGPIPVPAGLTVLALQR